MTLDGKYEVFATESAGEPFLFLNDLAFAPNGDLYVIDSGIADGRDRAGRRAQSGVAQSAYDGRMYRIDIRNAWTWRCVDRGLSFANGLAFGPDDTST